MSKTKEPTEPTLATVEQVVYTTPNAQSGDYSPETNPVIDRRQAYRINRMRIIDTSLDEGDKLHALGCVKRGTLTTHFIFTAKNDAQTRHDVHISFGAEQAENIWDALICSCPTGRHLGDPCWHKGAVRAFLADNQHIRYANKLLSLPLT